jgi:hypothetical protein
MKKRPFGLIALLLVVSLLAGCGSAGSGQPEPAAPAESEGSRAEPAEASEPAPEAPAEKLGLEIPEPIDGELLTDNGDGSFSVAVTDDIRREDYFRNILERCLLISGISIPPSTAGSKPS